MSDTDRVHHLAVAGRWEEAADEARRQLRERPDDAVLLAWLSRAMSKLGHHDHAVAAATAAAAREPEGHFVLGTLAYVFFEADRPIDAVAVAERLVQLYPNDAGAWTSLAEACRRTSRARGVVAARRAIELDPFSASAHNALGINESGRRASQSFRRALELDPSMTAARSNLADRSSPDEAAKLLIGLVREQPANEEFSRRALSVAVDHRLALGSTLIGALLVVGSVVAAIVGARADPPVGPQGAAGFGIIGVVILAAGLQRLRIDPESRTVLKAAWEDARTEAGVNRAVPPVTGLRGAADRPPAIEDPAVAAALRGMLTRAMVEGLLVVILVTLIVAATVTADPADTPNGSLPQSGWGVPVLIVGLSGVPLLTMASVRRLWLWARFRSVLRRSPWIDVVAEAAQVSDTMSTWTVVRYRLDGHLAVQRLSMSAFFAKRWLGRRTSMTLRIASTSRAPVAFDVERRRLLGLVPPRTDARYLKWNDGLTRALHRR